MKRILQGLVLAILMATSVTSCTTAYDAYGRPYEAVDPAAAVVGAAAVGLLAYGLANSHDHHHQRYYRRDYCEPSYGYRHSSYYGGGYRRNYCYY